MLKTTVGKISGGVRSYISVETDIMFVMR